jgi:hypothetical protein
MVESPGDAGRLAHARSSWGNRAVPEAVQVIRWAICPEERAAGRFRDPGRRRGGGSAVAAPDASLLLYPVYFAVVNSAPALLIQHRRIPRAMLVRLTPRGELEADIPYPATLRR